MTQSDKALQGTLNVFGFVFVTLGLALDSGAALAMLGLSIAMFVGALGVAIAGARR